jgi:hypothetical protein
VIVLGLDPSSTRTGYAILQGIARLDLLDAGYLRPNKTRDPLLERVRAMRADLGRILFPDPAEGEAGFEIGAVCIEIPATQAPITTRSGQANYGLAVGVLLADVWDWAEGLVGARHVLAVKADDWTHARPKAQRQKVIGQLYPQVARYLETKDTGGDVADAIGLARHYLERSVAGF